ncbi:hypothetical protein HS088_TW06G00094 [Tripterygium wilfordii]|uniref:Uncharacterized protein n=1 Tax=Tripterygium wilfordii TaxID=458696 RepID=A0A7J7DI17_TRIWF|nr:hypothetical protein HS088_TW06G00094 [Tripterygium wilfordii]
MILQILCSQVTSVFKCLLVHAVPGKGEEKGGGLLVGTDNNPARLHQSHMNGGNDTFVGFLDETPTQRHMFGVEYTDILYKYSSNTFFMLVCISVLFIVPCKFYFDWIIKRRYTLERISFWLLSLSQLLLEDLAHSLVRTQLVDALFLHVSHRAT